MQSQMTKNHKGQSKVMQETIFLHNTVRKKGLFQTDVANCFKKMHFFILGNFSTEEKFQNQPREFVCQGDTKWDIIRQNMTTLF